MIFQRRQRWTTGPLPWVLGLCAVACLLAACSSTDLPSVTPSCGPGDPAPQFSGPWKDLFDAEYANTRSNAARAILCDGVVSDAEASEMNDLLRQCMEDQGLLNIEINQDGSLGYAPPPGTTDENAAPAAVSQCETDIGWFPVIPIYTNVRTNPDRLDPNQLTADCLVRFGLRPPGYDAQDFQEELADKGSDFPDISGDPHFSSCLTDPLHTQ